MAINLNTFSAKVFLVTTLWSYCTHASYAVPVADKDMAEARRLYQNAEQSKSVALCSKKIAAGKNLAQWYELRAQALSLDKGVHANAENDIKKALSLAPKDEHIIASAGFVLADGGANALWILPKVQEAIKLHPQNGRCHAALSDCYQSLHNPRSEEEIVTAIKLDPSDFDVNLHAVEHYLQLQKTDEINKAYDRLVKFNSQSAYAYAQRGIFARDSYNLKSASHDLQRATELNPKYTLAYSMWSKCLSRTEQFPEAIRVLSAIINSGECNDKIYARRASCYSHANQIEKAIKDYDQAIKLCTKGNERTFASQSTVRMDKDHRLDYNKYWLERVECRERIGQLDQGIEELTSYINGNPHFESALEIRQRLLRKKGLFDKALLDLNRLIAKDPFVADRYQDRAEVLNKLGRSIEAKKDLKHAENIESTGSP